MQNKITWVTSYPKSGNTWMRLILCGLFYSDNGKVNFSNLKKIDKFDKLKNFSFIKKISNKSYSMIFNKSHFDEESVLEYSKHWITAQKKLIKNNKKILFFKTHNARIKINNNQYTNKQTSNGFIYIVRDPRDIAVSYSRHMNKSLEFTINYLINGQIMGNEMDKQLMPEITLNWENHYLSWKKFIEVPNIFIKYEDLLQNPEKQIKNIVKFFINNYNIEFSNIDNKIKNIIETTSFKNLKLKEGKYGFNESKGIDGFFREGKKNQWKNKLNKKEINLINTTFSQTMNKLNYS